MEIIKRRIVLTFDELRILLYSQGYRRCEGVYMPEKDFSEENIIRSLSILEKNGLLIVDREKSAVESLPLVFSDEIPSDSEPDTSKAVSGACSEIFFIRTDLLNMIRIIGEPKATEILSIDQDTRIFCYFSENGIVTSQRYPGRKECVRLTCYTTEDFKEWRLELEEEQQ